MWSWSSKEMLCLSSKIMSDLNNHFSLWLSGASLYFPKAVSAMIENPLGHELAKTLRLHKLAAYLSFSILVLDDLMPRLDFLGLMPINHEAKTEGLRDIILFNGVWESFIISYPLTSSEVEDKRISPLHGESVHLFNRSGGGLWLQYMTEASRSLFYRGTLASF